MKCFIFLQRLDFFRKYVRSLKHVMVTLGRTNVLHHFNRLLIYLNSKFDELKDFNQVHDEQKCNKFLPCLEFFLHYKTGHKESQERFMQNRCDVLYYYNRLLIVLNLNVDTVLTYKQSIFQGKICSDCFSFGIFCQLQNSPLKK